MKDCPICRRPEDHLEMLGSPETIDTYELCTMCCLLVLDDLINHVSEEQFQDALRLCRARRGRKLLT